MIGYDFVHQTRNIPDGDYLFEDPDPLDDNRHGTTVSGVISAKADNFYGGAGLAHDCKLVVLRAFAADGSAEDDDIARALVYAADNGVQVLNLSFCDIVPSSIMQAAIQYAYDQGTDREFRFLVRQTARYLGPCGDEESAAITGG